MWVIKFNSMSSYRQIIYQIVFCTKHRKPTISEPHCEQLYRYISGIVSKHKCHLYRINGVVDHIHILSDLHPSTSLADYVKNIKVASSIWLKESRLFPEFEGWARWVWSFYIFDQRKRCFNRIRQKPKGSPST